MERADAGGSGRTWRHPGFVWKEGKLAGPDGAGGEKGRRGVEVSRRRWAVCPRADMRQDLMCVWVRRLLAHAPCPGARMLGWVGRGQSPALRLQKREAAQPVAPTRGSQGCRVRWFPRNEAFRDFDPKYEDTGRERGGAGALPRCVQFC